MYRAGAKPKVIACAIAFAATEVKNRFPVELAEVGK